MIFNDLDYLSRIQCRSWYRKRKNEFASRWKRRMICYLERRESVKIENFCTLLEEFILRHSVTYSLVFNLIISHS